MRWLKSLIDIGLCDYLDIKKDMMNGLAMGRCCVGSVFGVLVCLLIVPMRLSDCGLYCYALKIVCSREKRAFDLLSSNL